MKTISLTHFVICRFHRDVFLRVCTEPLPTRQMARTNLYMQLRQRFSEGSLDLNEEKCKTIFGELPLWFKGTGLYVPVSETENEYKLALPYDWNEDSFKQGDFEYRVIEIKIPYTINESTSQS